jgi:hypothetical protein
MEETSEVAIWNAVGRFFPYRPGLTDLERARVADVARLDGIEWEEGADAAVEGSGPCRYGVADLKRAGLYVEDPLPPERRAALQKQLNEADYPPMFSEEYTNEYGEPLALFRSYLLEFQDRVGAHYDKEAGSEAAQMSRERFARTLRRAFPVPVFDRQAGKWRVGWGVRSLYEAVNLMLFLDLVADNRYLRRCKRGRCRRFFVSSDARATYCSPNCQKAVQMGRYRAGGRARQLHAEGMPLELIAEKLSTDVEKVREWIASAGRESKK